MRSVMCRDTLANEVDLVVAYAGGAVVCWNGETN